MVFSPEQARAVAEAVLRVERSVQSIQKLVEGLSQHMGVQLREVQTHIDQIGQHGQQAMRGIQKEVTNTVTLMTTGFSDAFSRMDNALDNVKRKLDIIERTAGGSAIFGNADGRGAVSGKFGGMQRLVGQARDSVLADVPFGGLIGLMMAGRNQDATYKALANQAVNLFQSTSRVAGQSVGVVQDRLQALKRDLNISADEYKTTFAALAEGGLGLTDALGKTKGATAGFGSSINEALLAADTLFKLASGEAAQRAADIVQDTGVSLQTATERIFQLGEAARGTGANIGTFLGTIAQAGSSLRMQRQDVDELSKVYFSLGESIKKAAPGASDQFVAKGALGAFQQITQTVGGFSVGVKGYLAQQMGLRGNIGQMLYQFDTGGKGTPGGEAGFLTKLLQTVQHTAAQSVGQDKYQQYLFYQLGPYKFSKEASQAMINLDLSKIKGPEDLKNFPELIKAVEGMRKGEQDPMERLLEQLRQLVASLGSLLLSGFAQLIRLIGASAVSASLIATGRAGDAREVMNASLDQAESQFGTAMDRFVESTKSAGPGMADFASSIFGENTLTADAARQYNSRRKSEREAAVAATALTGQGVGTNFSPKFHSVKVQGQTQSIPVGDGQMIVVTPEVNLNMSVADGANVEPGSKH